MPCALSVALLIPSQRCAAPQRPFAAQQRAARPPRVIAAAEPASTLSPAAARLQECAALGADYTLGREVRRHRFPPLAPAPPCLPAHFGHPLPTAGWPRLLCPGAGVHGQPHRCASALSPAQALQGAVPPHPGAAEVPCTTCPPLNCSLQASGWRPRSCPSTSTTSCRASRRRWWGRRRLRCARSAPPPPPPSCASTTCARTRPTSTSSRR